MRIAEDLPVRLTGADWRDGFVGALQYLLSPLDVFLSAVIINKVALLGILIAAAVCLMTRRARTRNRAGWIALGLGIIGALVTGYNAWLHVTGSLFYNPVLHLWAGVEALYAIGLGGVVWGMSRTGQGAGKSVAAARA